ncbi:hypothetical protein KC319_g4751, partial [Hortaea werneckii]
MASARSTTAAVDQTAQHVSQASSSTWERITSWYGENKVLAWTVAGVTVVVAGGSIYYLSQPPKASEQEKKAKKDRRKAA